VEFAARADGVPFMVEELLAAALSSGRWLPRPNRGGSASVPSRWFPAAAVLGASVDDGETITDRIAAWPVGCQNAAAVLDQRFQAAVS
jgi:hypothetical protein